MRVNAFSKGILRHNNLFFALFFLSLLMVRALVAPQSVSAQQMSSGWYWPTGSSNTCGYIGWLAYNPGWGYHLAQDICNSAGSPVYAIANGTVVSAGLHSGYGCNGTCSGGCVLVRHQASDGTWFTAMYGHLDNWVGSGSVTAGQVIGYTRGDWNPPHLHFSIHPGYDPEPNNPWRGYTSNTGTTYGFVDAFNFLSAHPATTNVGWASVSQLSVPSTVTIDQNFDISFTLKEIQGASKTYQNVALAILRADGTTQFDFAMYSNVTVPANGTWSRTATNRVMSIYAPPGTYRAMVRGKLNDEWFDFDTTGSGTNDKSFSVIAQPSDTTKPTINSFSVNTTSVSLGNSFSISYNVSDSGGSGLKQVELWFADDSGGTPINWSSIKTNLHSGNGPVSGSFSHTPLLRCTPPSRPCCKFRVMEGT